MLYQYAYDEAGSLVDVLHLPENRADLGCYTCIGCGQPLVAKTKGVHRAKHFAHRVVTPTCTEETYLHKLAKRVFWEEYQACLATQQPYTIDLTHSKQCARFTDILGAPVCWRSLTLTDDLTLYYDRIALEQRDGCFVPDLLLQSTADPTRKLYIEIAVTHAVTEQKVASGQRMIEIAITCEEEIEILRQRHLTRSNARFYNFIQKPITNGECLCAAEMHHCLLIYTSGKSYLMSGTLAEIAQKQHQVAGRLLHYQVVRDPDDVRGRGYVFVELVEAAYRQGIAVHNCFVCCYAGENWSAYDNSPIYCRLYRKRCGSNEAVTCKGFHYDRLMIRRLLPGG